MFDQYQDSYDKELGYEELSAKTLKELLFGRRIVDVRPGDKNYFGGLDTSALVLFVYTESSTKAEEILTLAGYEDNGFYGEGFELFVVGVETEAKNKEERWDYLK
nr:MAG TPA: hypothetical protein [Caudoviricetes sp.]